MTTMSSLQIDFRPRHKHLKLSSPLLDGIERTTASFPPERVIELLVKCAYDVHGDL